MQQIASFVCGNPSPPSSDLEEEPRLAVADLALNTEPVINEYKYSKYFSRVVGAGGGGTGGPTGTVNTISTEAKIMLTILLRALPPLHTIYIRTVLRQISATLISRLESQVIMF